MYIDNDKLLLRSLMELSALVDELIESYRLEKAFSTKDLLVKALECIENYKKNKSKHINSTHRQELIQKDEESIIYYDAASKMLSQVIPNLPDYQKMVMRKDLKDMHEYLINYLIKERESYDKIRSNIKKYASEDVGSRDINDDGDDDLTLRFKNLRNGSSAPSRAPPFSKSQSPSTVPPAKELELSENSSASSIVSPPQQLSVATNRISEQFKEFDDKDSISIDDISYLLENFPDAVLLIDLRRKREFELDHIRLTDNVIQIEPVSIRDNYSCGEIERYSMIVNTDEERELFKNRDKFELVILIDQSSTASRKSPELEKLIHILIFKNEGKFLKRNPVILEKGFNEWAHFKNTIKSPLDYPKLLLGTTRRDSVSSISSHEDLTSNHSPSYNESHLIRNVGEFLSKPKSTPYTQVQRRSSSQYQSRSSLPSTLTSGLSSVSGSNSDITSSNALAATPTKPKPVFYQPVSPSPQPTAAEYNSHSNGNFNQKPQLPPLPFQQPSRVTPYTNGMNVNGNSNGAAPPLPPIPHNLSRAGSTNYEFQQSLNVMTGLTNLGNSCYMNSGLQCLIGSKKLIEFFINGSFKRHININSKLGSKGILANEFYSLLSELYKRSSKYRPSALAPIHFKRILGSLNTAFKNADQQDCSEFLNYLLDSLHEDLNENGNHPPLPELTKEEEAKRELLPIRIASTIEWEKYLKTNFSIIVDIFQGQMLSQLKCLKCGTTSTTYNAFSTLSLPIPHSVEKTHLLSCFDEFVKPELLTDDNKWLCPNCKMKQRSVKFLKISRLPQVLIIHLKRFKLDSYLTKLNTYIDFPIDLDLDKYWPNVESQLDKLQLSKLPSRGQVPPFKYKLYGVINHYGNLINGHYTSFVNKGDDSNWCLFDDDKVIKNCSTNKVVSGDAYVLFYVRQ